MARRSNRVRTVAPARSGLGRGSGGGRRQTIYVASPLGFSEPGRIFSRALLIPLLRRAGYRVRDPWELTPARDVERVRRMRESRRRRQVWRRLNHQIADANRQAIEGADAVVAVLDGSDVDSGTAAEIGFAFARGKRIVGYRSDFRRSGDNEGATVNLQVEYFIRASGGGIVDRVADLRPALRRALVPRTTAGSPAQGTR